MQLRIAGPIHFAHAARAERPDDFVGTQREDPRRGLGEMASGPSMLKAADRGCFRPRRPTSRATRLHDAGLRRHPSPWPERPRARRTAVPRLIETTPSLAAIVRSSRSGFGAELTIQPRFRGAPIAFGSRWRHAEYMCGFLDGESAKRTQLDDPGQFSVDLFQAIECASPTQGWGSRQTRPHPSLRRLTHTAPRRPACLRSDAGRDRPESCASPAPTTPKKCARFCQSTSRWSTSRMYTS